MPGIIKIGWTDNTVEQRMKELDKTSTPLPFTCYYAKRVNDPTFVESKLHQAFDEFRIRNNREFFRMAPEHAKAFMNALSDNIDKFESKNGKIRSTTNQRFENYPVKDVEDSLPN